MNSKEVLKVCDDGILIKLLFLDITCPVFYLKHDVSETGFCKNLLSWAQSTVLGRWIMSKNTIIILTQKLHFLKEEKITKNVQKCFKCE
jgi:hypothetical protein